MNIAARIEKLEARRRTGDEMLMLWRKPGTGIDAAMLSANKAGLFVSGDLVLCGEWYGDDDMPSARWVRRIVSDLTPPERESLYQTLKKQISSPARNGSSTDVPHLCDLPDEALWERAIGVET
jgi:hypothetical protein